MSGWLLFKFKDRQWLALPRGIEPRFSLERAEYSVAIALRSGDVFCRRDKLGHWIASQDVTRPEPLPASP